MRVVVCLCVCVCFGLLAGTKCRPRHPEKRKTVFSRVVPRLSHVVVSSEVISVALARAAGVHLGQGRVVFFRETILVWKERGADYSFRPPTISPRRPLLTRMGCRGIPPAAEKTRFFPGTILVLKKRGADYAFWLPTFPPGATPAYNDGLPTMPSGRRLWPTLPPNTTPAHKGRRRPAHPV